MSDRYDPAAIEPKWQAYWDAHQTFRAERHPAQTPGRPRPATEAHVAPGLVGHAVVGVGEPGPRSSVTSNTTDASSSSPATRVRRAIARLDGSTPGRGRTCNGEFSGSDVSSATPPNPDLQSRPGVPELPKSALQETPTAGVFGILRDCR